MADYTTKIGDLLNPQVLGAFLDVKLMDAIKFAPLCAVRNDLVGKPGDTLTLPQYKFIGIAQDVPEGTEVPMAKLGYKEVPYTVKKAGIGVELTDEAILSAYGDPVNEVGKQLLMSIAGKVDNDCVDAFRTAAEDMTVQADKFDKYVISDMMAKFGEDIEEEMVAIIHPEHLAELRRDTDFIQVNHGDVIMNGEVGQLFGCRIVVSNKAYKKNENGEVEEKNAFLVKAGAVKILMKRNVMVETDRNIINKTNQFVVDEHYVVYLEDESKLVKAVIA